jgi:putative membrane protein
MISNPRLPSLVVSLVLLAGCRGIAPRATAPSTPSATSAGATRVSDEHVAGIALMANNVEIGYALLAAARATDADVKAYAARMHTDHTSLNATLTDLLSVLDVDARDDPAGIALRESSIPRSQGLRGLSGHAFDVAYVDLDVQSHREMLDVIDRVLRPSVDRRELREYVASLRPAVAAHLAHAEQLRATLAARRQ